MKLQTIRDNGRKAEQGAWVGNLQGAGDLELRVRAFGNSDFMRRQAELYEAEPAENKPRGVLLPQVARKIDDILLVETILTDWKNLEDDDGLIAYSREKAAELIDEPESDFRMYVNIAAGAVRTNGKFDVAEAAGNSKTRSAGR